VFLTYLKRELRRRTRQTLVVVVGLAVGIGLVITVNAASAGVADAQSQVLSSLYGVGTDITVTQRVQPGQRGEGPGPFDFGSGDTSSDVVTQDRLMLGGGVTPMESATIATILEQPHVYRAVGSLSLTDITVTGDFTPPEPGQGPGGGPGGGGVRPQIDVNSFSINGVDVTALDIGPLSSSSLTEGRAFTADDATAPVALVSATYANEHGLAVGDTLTITGTDVTIVGLASSATGDSVDVYLPLGTAQALSGQTDKVTTIYVQATSAQDVAAAESEIQAALPEVTVTTASELAEQISGSLSSAADLADNLGRWLSIVVLVAAFAVAALLTMSGVSRRVREFGTLKAIGWRGRRIVGQVMGESLVHGLLGGALGIGLGVLGAFLVSSLAPELTATVTSGFGGRGGPAFAGGPPGGAAVPPGGAAAPPGGELPGPGAAFRAASTVAVRLSAPVTMTAIGLAVGLALVGGLVAGGFGAWRASRLRPADALRRID
jgi:ABC-type lipoprotein release transport system permease subunit